MLRCLRGGIAVRKTSLYLLPVEVGIVVIRLDGCAETSAIFLVGFSNLVLLLNQVIVAFVDLIESFERRWDFVRDSRLNHGISKFLAVRCGCAGIWIGFNRCRIGCIVFLAIADLAFLLLEIKRTFLLGLLSFLDLQRKQLLRLLQLHYLHNVAEGVYWLGWPNTKRDGWINGH